MEDQVVSGWRDRGSPDEVGRSSTAPESPGEEESGRWWRGEGMGLAPSVDLRRPTSPRYSVTLSSHVVSVFPSPGFVTRRLCQKYVLLTPENFPLPTRSSIHSPPWQHDSPNAPTNDGLPPPWRHGYRRLRSWPGINNNEERESTAVFQGLNRIVTPPLPLLSSPLSALSPSARPLLDPGPFVSGLSRARSAHSTWTPVLTASPFMPCAEFRCLVLASLPLFVLSLIFRLSIPRSIYFVPPFVRSSRQEP